jgi:hypothetical protein
LATPDRSLIAGLPVFEGIASAGLHRIIGQARSIRIAKDQPVFEQEARAGDKGWS